MIVELAAKTGFCFGVKRAIDMLSRAAAGTGVPRLLVDRPQQASDREVSAPRITVARDLEGLEGDVVAIGSHGVSPEVEAEMKARFPVLVDTTCPFVHRAQSTAQKHAAAGFTVIIYGEAEHAESKAFWATHMAEDRYHGFQRSTWPESLPRKVSVLSQTTQIPSRFVDFGKEILGSLLDKDVELRFTDTICHDIRTGRSCSDAGRRVDLMIVVGSRTSANSNHLSIFALRSLSQG